MPAGELWNSIRGARCNGLTGFSFSSFLFRVNGSIVVCRLGASRRFPSCCIHPLKAFIGVIFVQTRDEIVGFMEDFALVHRLPSPPWVPPAFRLGAR